VQIAAVELTARQAQACQKLAEPAGAKKQAATSPWPHKPLRTNRAMRFFLTGNVAGFNYRASLPHSNAPSQFGMSTGQVSRFLTKANEATKIGPKEQRFPDLSDFLCWPKCQFDGTEFLIVPSLRDDSPNQLQVQQVADGVAT
jgi:hypothetical protein